MGKAVAGFFLHKIKNRFNLLIFQRNVKPVKSVAEDSLYLQRTNEPRATLHQKKSSTKKQKREEKKAI